MTLREALDFIEGEIIGCHHAGGPMAEFAMGTLFELKQALTLLGVDIEPAPEPPDNLPF
jgi:hypothetical protein